MDGPVSYKVLFGSIVTVFLAYATIAAQAHSQEHVDQRAQITELRIQVTTIATSLENIEGHLGRIARAAVPE